MEEVIQEKKAMTFDERFLALMEQQAAAKRESDQLQAEFRSESSKQNKILSEQMETLAKQGTAIQTALEKLEKHETRFERSESKILDLEKASVGQATRIVEVDERMNRLEANNLNEKFDEKIAGVRDFVKEETSSAVASLHREITTLEQNFTDRVRSLEGRLQENENALLDETLRNYNGVAMAVGELQGSSQNQAAQIKEMREAFGKILQGVEALISLDPPDPLRGRSAGTSAVRRERARIGDRELEEQSDGRFGSSVDVGFGPFVRLRGKQNTDSRFGLSADVGFV